MEQRKLVPRRRFAGFVDEWSERKLEKTLDLIKDGTHGTHKNVENGVFLLSAKNIKNGKIHIDDSDRKISEVEYEAIHKTFELKIGDVLLTIVGSIGESAIIHDAVGFTFQRSVAYLRPNEKIVSEFLYAIINTSEFQKELKNKQVNSAQSGIYLGDLSEIPIFFPCIEEQQRIGSFFKQLDEMIGTQQRKVEKVKALKSAYLAEMFPAEGECVPKRRFAGFTGAWEERYLFDNIKRIIDFRGRTPKKLGLKWSDIGYLALSALNVKNGYIDFKADAYYGNQDLYDKWMLGSELKKGQVLFTTEAPMGNVAQVPDNRGYILSQRTIAFVVIPEKITDDFLAVLLHSPRTFAKLSILSSGGTAKGVSQKSLEQFKVAVPVNLKEQQKIGKFFKQLDDKITNAERKLEKLKAMKQAFLHEMFV
ncbi:restriction endonuclease subunit S [Virgibacillus sp. NKC19-3]|uniref:restriction endonuclease subunit S n=1 Tax=Virgibacillus saliphilus TaxID=2831674 RepID=UPI001C9AF933|nr:restriction endonuclease subunit S [Virgibacillus sp. NKC19-3]MBY7143062.1 restriction endonuclease subunit S [Virgibacillus sp. NKC19-3]